MLLKKGSKGEEVKKLQTKLGIVPDGDFGPGTESKVKEWQRLNGLTVDGVVGEETWKKLFPSESDKNKAVSTKFKLEALKGHVPDYIISQIPETAEKFGINTVLRLSHFLAQCAHESGGFKVFEENLNYSSARLKAVFPKYFPGNLNESYNRNPQKIANRVYSSRMGNGNESSGDGWKYRGRGAIQLTGKSRYLEFDKFVDDNILDNPELVATKYQLMSAAWFFWKNKIFDICDLGSDTKTVAKVSTRVNGGSIGLDDRIMKFQKFYNLLK